MFPFFGWVGSELNYCSLDVFENKNLKWDEMIIKVVTTVYFY